MSTTGERIRELRKRNGYTLDDVARQLGIGRQAVYKYEQGAVTNIPLDNIVKMAAMFGTTPGYLAGWSESRLVVDEPETHLINLYRDLSVRGKNLLIERAEELKLLYGK